MSTFLDDAKDTADSYGISKEEPMYYFITSNGRYLDSIEKKAYKGLFGKDKSDTINSFISDPIVSEMLFDPAKNELIDIILEFITDKNTSDGAADYLTDIFIGPGMLCRAMGDHDFYELLLSTTYSQIDLISFFYQDDESVSDYSITKRSY